MFGFIRRLFRQPEDVRPVAAGREFAASRPSPTIVFSGHWCRTDLKLPIKIPTPMGGNVTLVNVRVDIAYLIAANEIAIHGVRLTQDGESNLMSTRRGESWRQSRICPEEDLVRVVQADLEEEGSWLRGAMYAKWRGVKGAH